MSKSVLFFLKYKEYFLKLGGFISMILPIITLIGRKNVGKSTLFNRLTHTSDALVSSTHLGLTRDRRYGSFKWENSQFIIIDTGGLESSVRHGMDISVFNQSKKAIVESNLVLFIVDGQVGLMPGDRDILCYLYKFQRSIFVIVNKIDDYSLVDLRFEFYSLGIKKVIFISAMHGYGINYLLNEIFFQFHHKKSFLENKFFSEKVQLKIFLKDPSSFLKGKGKEIIRLAIIGSPNVGKSTFINYVLGENRMIVSSLPGTTRDSICTSMIYDNYKWILIDTAGMRKKNKTTSAIEEVSIMNTLQKLQDATVVLLLINAYCGINSYDLSLLNSVLRSGKSLVIGINKWDLLSNNLRKKFKIMCDSRLRFIPFVNKSFISSLSGYGVRYLLKLIIEAHCSSFKFVSTSRLTRIMRLAVNKCPPPRVCNKQVKLKYAHMGGYVPFVVVVHGSHVTGLPDHYKRYLENYFLYFLKLSGLSILIRFKEGS